MRVLLNPAAPTLNVPEAEKTLKELAEFSAKPENHWKSGEPIAKNPDIFTRHVVVPCTSGHQHTLHIIFTHTIGFLTDLEGNLKGEKVVRHATIGMDDFQKFPEAAQVNLACKSLGFEGSAADWVMESHPQWDNCVVVTQLIVPPGDGKVLHQMYFKKGGATREEFWPVQDLANDPKGQEQASKLVRAIRLRISLEKAGMTPVGVKMLMDIWNGKPPSNEEPVPVDLLMKTPISLSEEEKEVFLELRKTVLGY